MVSRNALKDSLVTLISYKGCVVDEKKLDENANVWVLSTKDN